MRYRIRKLRFYAKFIELSFYDSNNFYVELIQRRFRQEYWVHINGEIFIHPAYAK